MFIKHIVVEASISNSKTSKLPRVSIRISAALDGRRDEPKLKQFLIKEASMSAQISNEVAHLGSNWSILMNNKILEIIINIWIVNIFIKVFWNPSQLRNETQSINNQDWTVIVIQQSILVDDSQPIALDELLSKLLGALSAEDKSGNESDANWNWFGC